MQGMRGGNCLEAQRIIDMKAVRLDIKQFKNKHKQ